MIKNFIRSVSPLMLNAAAQATWSVPLITEGIPALIQSLLKGLLKRFPGFIGSIGAIHFRLFSGRIEIIDFVLDKKATRERSVRFLKIPQIAVRLRWKQLLQGRFVGDIEIQRPTLLIDFELWRQHGLPRPDGERRHDAASTWQAAVRRSVPFKIETLRVQDGAIRLVNWIPEANDSLDIQGVEIEARDIANRPELGGATPAAYATAHIASSGKLEWNVQGNVLDANPSLLSSLKLENFQLRDIQQLIRRSFNVELKQGVLEVFAEAEIQAGRFKGYVKPIFDHLHIERIQPPGIWPRLKAWILQSVIRVLRNPGTDRIATRIHFQGPWSDPHVNHLAVLSNFIKNAFGTAFKAQLDDRWRRYFHKGPAPAEATYTYGKPAAGGWGLFKKAFSRWKEHEAPRMSASLSYYTCFSLAPLLLLMIAVIGLVFGHDAAQGYVLSQLSSLVGAKSAETIQTMIAAAWKPSQGLFALLVSVITLLAGAFGVLSELKVGLNRVMKATEPGGLGEIIKERAKFIGLILGIGFLLLVSLALSAALSALGHFLAQTLPLPEWTLHALELILSMGVITLLFAMMFRFLPNRQVDWRSIRAGSVLTALLFTAGKFILGLYLGRSGTASAYGAAGSVLVVLLWVYYSAFILYFGAEWTMAYSEKSA